MSKESKDRFRKTDAGFEYNVIDPGNESTIQNISAEQASANKPKIEKKVKVTEAASSAETQALMVGIEKHLDREIKNSENQRDSLLSRSSLDPMIQFEKFFDKHLGSKEEVPQASQKSSGTSKTQTSEQESQKRLSGSKDLKEVIQSSEICFAEDKNVSNVNGPEGVNPPKLRSSISKKRSYDPKGDQQPTPSVLQTEKPSSTELIITKGIDLFFNNCRKEFIELLDNKNLIVPPYPFSKLEKDSDFNKISSSNSSLNKLSDMFAIVYSKERMGLNDRDFSTVKPIQQILSYIEFFGFESLEDLIKETERGMAKVIMRPNLKNFLETERLKLTSEILLGMKSHLERFREVDVSRRGELKNRKSQISKSLTELKEVNKQICSGEEISSQFDAMKTDELKNKLKKFHKVYGMIDRATAEQQITSARLDELDQVNFQNSRAVYEKNIKGFEDTFCGSSFKFVREWLEF